MDIGFIITEVDGRPVATLDELIGQLGKASSKVMLEGVYEGYRGEYYYAFPLD